MVKFITALHLALLAYAGFDFMFLLNEDGSILKLLTFTANPSLLYVFMMLGLYPLYYFMVAKATKSQTKIHYLSFLLGGFVLLPLLKQETYQPKNLNKRYRLVFLFLSSALALYALGFSHTSHLLSAYQGSSFVRIMTLDFIMLYTVTAVLLIKKRCHLIIALIPGVGFYPYLSEVNHENT